MVEEKWYRAKSRRNCHPLGRQWPHWCEEHTDTSSTTPLLEALLRKTAPAAPLLGSLQTPQGPSPWCLPLLLHNWSTPKAQKQPVWLETGRPTTSIEGLSLPVELISSARFLDLCFCKAYQLHESQTETLYNLVSVHGVPLAPNTCNEYLWNSPPRFSKTSWRHQSPLRTSQ